MSMVGLFFYAFDIVFDFWPLLLINAVRKRQTAIRDMRWAWSGWAIVRVILFFAPEPLPPIVPFMKEPWSTIAFFLVGIILFSILIASQYFKQSRLKSKALGIKSVDELLDVSPAEFEDMTVALYRAFGHQAKRTGKSGDHGVDVIIKAKNGETWIAQCKRWRKKVGEPIVRDFYGTLQHQKAHQGAIFAVNGFTKPAIEWARGKPIMLYDGEEFLKTWRRAEQLALKKNRR